MTFFWEGSWSSVPAWVGGALCRTGLTGNGRSLAPTNAGPCRFYPAPASSREVQAIRGRLPVHATIASSNNPMSGRYVGERFTRSAAEIARRATEVSRVAGCCDRAVGRSTSLVALRAISRGTPCESLSTGTCRCPTARSPAVSRLAQCDADGRVMDLPNHSDHQQPTLKAGCIDELCIKNG